MRGLRNDRVDDYYYAEQFSGLPDLLSSIERTLKEIMKEIHKFSEEDKIKWFGEGEWVKEPD